MKLNDLNTYMLRIIKSVRKNCRAPPFRHPNTFPVRTLCYEAFLFSTSRVHQKNMKTINHWIVVARQYLMSSIRLNFTIKLVPDSVPKGDRVRI
jgi:hypothetical protein